MASQEIKTYHGNCHCATFRFSFKLSDEDLKFVRTCNCSICHKKGYVWMWPIKEEDFKIESEDGESVLSVYEFAGKVMKHYFCGKCGSAVMGRRKDRGGEMGINARVLQDTPLSSFNMSTFDGNSIYIEPVYLPPEFPRWEGEVEEGMVVRNGNCHCKAVKWVVKTKPLSEISVIDCNCSLCSRNGDIWFYPPASAVKFYGEENLTGYAFLSRTSLHSFCKLCGVNITTRVLEEGVDLAPLNLRAAFDVDIEKLKITQYDGMSKDPKYVIGEPRPSEEK